MKKMQYIQPKMDTVVMPERAMMEFQASPAIDPQQGAPSRANMPAQGAGYKPF